MFYHFSLQINNLLNSNAGPLACKLINHVAILIFEIILNLIILFFKAFYANDILMSAEKDIPVNILI